MSSPSRNSNLPTLAIIGPGRIGTSIAISAHRAGYPVIIGGRNYEKCQSAAALVDQASGLSSEPTVTKSAVITETASQANTVPLVANDSIQTLPSHLSATRSTTVIEAAAQANIVLLTVSDNSIQALCEELSSTGSFTAGTVVVHTSGALSSSVLESAKSGCDCKIASAHPLQTFASIESAYEDLPGTYWFLEGDDEAIEVLNKLVRDIGGLPNTISAEQKSLYHAASVFAGNYLTTVIDTALKLMEKASVHRDVALNALQPLIRSAINNTLEVGPEQALTGPISRGDTSTVKHHIDALTACAPAVLDFYRTAAQHTIELALRKGSINNAQATELLTVLGTL